MVVTQTTSNALTVAGFIKKTNGTAQPFNSTSNAVVKCGNKEHEEHPGYDLSGAAGTSWIQVICHTFTDVSGSGVTVSFSFDGLLSEWYPKGSIEKTITLKETNASDSFIIKIGSASGSETSLLTLGETYYIVPTGSNADTHRHRISFIYGGRYDSSVIHNAGSFATHPTLRFANEITNSESVTATARLETYSGDTLIGRTDRNITLKVPDTQDYRPSCTFSFNSKGKNALASSLITESGIYPQGMSEISLNVTLARAGEGAKLERCELFMSGYATLYDRGDKSSYGIAPGTLTIAGSRTLTARLFDSRGRKAEETKIIYVSEYKKASFTGSVTRKEKDNDTVNDYITISGLDISTTVMSKITDSSGDLIELSDIEGCLDPTVSVFYRGSGNLSFTQISPSDFSGSSATFEGLRKKAYDVKIEITDCFGEETSFLRHIGSAQVDMHMRDGKVRFGSYIDTERDVPNSFEVDWKSYFNERVYLKGDPPLYIKNGNGYVSLQKYIEDIIKNINSGTQNGG